MKTRPMDIQNIPFFLMHHLLDVTPGFSMLIAYLFSKFNILLENTSYYLLNKKVIHPY